MFIPIPIPVKSEIILEWIPILESESSITTWHTNHKSVKVFPHLYFFFSVERGNDMTTLYIAIIIGVSAGILLTALFTLGFYWKMRSDRYGILLSGTFLHFSFMTKS